MILNIKSSLPLTMDVEDIVEQSGVENGDSTSVIRYKVLTFFEQALQIPNDMKTNLKEIVDLVVDEIKESLYYYIIK